MIGFELTHSGKQMPQSTTYYKGYYLSPAEDTKMTGIEDEQCIVSTTSQLLHNYRPRLWLSEGLVARSEKELMGSGDAYSSPSTVVNRHIAFF